MKPPRKGRGRKPPGGEASPPADWSPFYGPSGMVFDEPDSDTGAAPAPPTTENVSSSTQAAVPDAPSSAKADEQPAEAPVAAPATPRADSANPFAYGPSGMVFDLTEGELAAESRASASVGAIEDRGGRGFGRLRFPRWQVPKVQVRRYMLGALGLAAIGLAIGWLYAWYHEPPPESHWLIKVTPDRQALVGRLRKTRYGTVSVRVDVISRQPGAEQWNLFVACPAGIVEYRSGDRWADQAREQPLGLGEANPRWEADAVALACKGIALEGPFSSFESALPRALSKLADRANAPGN